MSKIPSPILVFGDPYVSKNNIIGAKKKYPINWVTKSASTDSLDSIRMEAGLVSWDGSEKVLLIQDLPNRKNVREFILDIASTSPDSTKIIIWDSTNCIKEDPETKKIEKTWSEFVSDFKKISGAKIVNNGEELNEKKSDDAVSFVIQCFGRYKKQCDPKEAILLINIVGHDRGMLDSDIKKMSLICPEKVTPSFIIENAYPSTKEAVLYKFNNIIDSGTYEECLEMMERFVNNGINVNILAEILAKKARWQLATAYWWSSGYSWNNIPNQLMEMGRFPSAIWYNPNVDSFQKRKEAEQYQTIEGMRAFLDRRMGISTKYFKSLKDKQTKKNKSVLTRKGAEIIPMYFMAQQTVDFVKTKIAWSNDFPEEQLKEKLLNRALKVFVFIQNKLAEIRYGENPMQDLQEMIKILTNTSLSF